MDESSKLFLNTLSDLETRLGGTGYDLLRASALLRQLLLDGTPLVHLVNRRHRVRLEFTTLDTTVRPPIVPTTHWQNLDTSQFPHAKTRTVKIHGLLATYLLSYRGEEFTVRDVIKAGAELKGGVHSLNPRTDEERVLRDLDDVLNVGGLDASTAAMRGIIQVVLRGFRPLFLVVSQ